MSKNISRELEEFEARFRPLNSHSNTTVSRNGHNCNLPVFIGAPVSLDPRTGERASRRLIVRCTICSTLWGVRHSSYGFDGPDLVWFEKRPVAKWLLKHRAINFNASVAYKKPDPTAIDWSLEGPRKLNGMRWNQIEFPEMLGTKLDQCSATTRLGHAKNGEKMRWASYRCLLKTEHRGLHESFSADSGAIGWSTFIRI